MVFDVGIRWNFGEIWHFGWIFFVGMVFRVWWIFCFDLDLCFLWSGICLFWVLWFFAFCVVWIDFVILGWAVILVLMWWFPWDLLVLWIFLGCMSCGFVFVFDFVFVCTPEISILLDLGLALRGFELVVVFGVFCRNLLSLLIVDFWLVGLLCLRFGLFWFCFCLFTAEIDRFLFGLVICV